MTSAANTSTITWKVKSIYKSREKKHLPFSPSVMFQSRDVLWASLADETDHSSTFMRFMTHNTTYIRNVRKRSPCCNSSQFQQKCIIARWVYHNKAVIWWQQYLTVSYLSLHICLFPSRCHLCRGSCRLLIGLLESTVSICVWMVIGWTASLSRWVSFHFLFLNP